MVLRNFYVEDICDIVHSGVNGFIEVKVDESREHFPVHITVEDGHKYEINYIYSIIDNQKK